MIVLVAVAQEETIGMAVAIGEEEAGGRGGRGRQ